ncbi:MAG: rhomboid family intramembrane serine protease [Acidobacteria bacterium]|nr:rhomboid family intramembrane serine protease [Acidobacteriota bacterium]MBV9626372.1 rhomboid family intramembrane serine protease [Acidobacteriota bacterium]
MARNTSFEMGLPPFRGAVRVLLLASVAIYVVILLLMSFAPGFGRSILELGILDPVAVRHGWLWQFVTYPFMYVDPLDFVLSLGGIYFLGWSVEAQIGSSAFYGLFFGSVSISALVGFLLSLLGIAEGTAFGSGAAANAILMVFYLFNRGAPIMLFPLPMRFPVKWLVLFTAGIETAYLLLHHFALFYFILLLGLGAGYVWYSLFLNRQASIGISETYYGLRNSYYRWKRRRAARKFEVYMRGHNRKVSFDEHGNYIPPDDPDKKNGGSKSGWVN